jgi:hypothetical protein
MCTDYRNGNILILSLGTYTDYNCGPDNSIYRKFITPIISDNRQRTIIDSIELDMETGISPVPLVTTTGNEPLALVSLSKDGSRTFNYERIVNMGNQGQYNTRVRLNRWGVGRDMTLKVETNHSQFAAINSLIAEVDPEIQDQAK